MPQKKRDGLTFPWGRAIGLLVACVATMVGAWQGASPAHLLYRACIGSVLVCLIVNCFVRLVARTSTTGRGTVRRS